MKVVCIEQCNENVMVFIVLYVDDIILIRNNEKVLSDIKKWLSKQFNLMNLGDMTHILGIKVTRDCKKKMCLSQRKYIDTIVTCFSM